MSKTPSLSDRDACTLTALFLGAALESGYQADSDALLEHARSSIDLLSYFRHAAQALWQYRSPDCLPLELPDAATCFSMRSRVAPAELLEYGRHPFPSTLPKWDGRRHRGNGKACLAFFDEHLAPYKPTRQQLREWNPSFASILGTYLGDAMQQTVPTAAQLRDRIYANVVRLHGQDVTDEIVRAATTSYT